MAHDESHVTVNDVLLAKREVDTYARRSLRVKVLLSLVSGLLSALVFAGAGWLFIRSNIVDLVLPIALVGVFFGALPLVDHVRRVRDLRQRLSSLEARGPSLAQDAEPAEDLIVGPEMVYRPSVDGQRCRPQ